MISLKNLKILTHLQKLPKNARNLGKIIVAKDFEKLKQSPINRPVWSHWTEGANVLMYVSGECV